MSENVFGGKGVEAWAKVNFALEVIRARDDGYHDIRSVVVPISLSDTLAFEDTDGIIETVVDGCAPSSSMNGCCVASKNNLCTRAAVLLKDLTGHNGGVRILLKKRIPVGGGLGGGSSDAATVLKTLNKWWNTGLGSADLMEIGAKLGCDIPALIHGGAVLVEGRGEYVTALSVSDDICEKGWWIVLANPGINVSTKDIYSRHSSSSLTLGRIHDNSIVSALANGDIGAAACGLFNDLQATVCRKYPLIGILV
ncbi:MAG: 4-(cytidine 5'-diphospho)-2-C-methyl-D-erythritol kinase, partial [Lentisphaerae bacterium]|nr:4-(cytidine 5'-diphospho)-2-C-methyl-D-erythritol kinase [Lentisphaerota bacterium]